MKSEMAEAVWWFDTSALARGDGGPHLRRSEPACIGRYLTQSAVRTDEVARVPLPNKDAERVTGQIREDKQRLVQVVSPIEHEFCA